MSHPDKDIRVWPFYMVHYWLVKQIFLSIIVQTSFIGQFMVISQCWRHFTSKWNKMCQGVKFLTMKRPKLIETLGCWPIHFLSMIWYKVSYGNTFIWENLSFQCHTLRRGIDLRRSSKCINTKSKNTLLKSN